jgi:nucleoside-diphosphate-sugar epimerase
MILVTGSAGLLGRHVTTLLEAAGDEVRTFDLRDAPHQDIRDPKELARAMEGVDGVIHLAAVSRVVWAQKDPALTEAVNHGGLRNVLKAAASRAHRPWILFASSREVYGEQAHLPVAETAPLGPLNVYARSKVAGEVLMGEARDQGLVANVARLSNVYGCVDDHHDRVVPAFARGAATASALRLEGSDNMFDFTHVDDVARGIVRMAEASAAGESLPTTHFVSGCGTTLGQLATLAVEASERTLACIEYAPRDYDVARFYGDPSRALALLGWRAHIGIEQGFSRLVDDFRSVLTERGERRASLPAGAVAPMTPVARAI